MRKFIIRSLSKLFDVSEVTNELLLKKKLD